jgi:Ran GTPase-activating protein (RanGAP) involved in mRNA processing and transport
MALSQNANLTVLKLGYNNLCDAGATTLASGIATHKSLTLLDLGFNNIGDDGIKALATAMQQQANIVASSKQQQQQKSRAGTLETLYLAGNLIGEDGAMALADFIRNGSRLRKLYMTGNRIGGDGVKAITEAIIEDELTRPARTETNDDDTSMEAEGGADSQTNGSSAGTNVTNGRPSQQSFHGSYEGSAVDSTSSAASTEKTSRHRSNGTDNFHGMQELFLGGTGMGSVGCQAVSRLLQKSRSIRVISLPNCDIGDEEVAMLAASIKQNKDRLPIVSIQLSFNKITHKGLESLTNALWGSTTLKELEVDNNEIGDQGAHHIAAVVPGMSALRVLDVGFNSIKAAGINVLMKTIAESEYLESFSISGNSIDVNAAKAVAYALAYNCSLTSIHLVHCSIDHEGQRHVSAGIVSNSRTALQKLTGFDIGRTYSPVLPSLFHFCSLYSNFVFNLAFPF